MIRIRELVCQLLPDLGLCMHTNHLLTEILRRKPIHFGSGMKCLNQSNMTQRPISIDTIDDDTLLVEALPKRYRFLL